MEPIAFQPEKKPRNVILFSMTFFVLAAVFSMLSTVAGDFKTVCQVAAVLLVLTVVQVTVRYVLTDYIYVLDSENFIVRKVKGKTAFEVCNTDMKNAVALYVNENIKNIEKIHGKMNYRFDFCQNMAVKETCVYVFGYDGKQAAVFLECNGSFLDELKKRLEFFKNSEKNEE